MARKDREEEGQPFLEAFPAQSPVALFKRMPRGVSELTLTQLGIWVFFVCLFLFLTSLSLQFPRATFDSGQ